MLLNHFIFLHYLFCIVGGTESVSSHVIAATGTLSYIRGKNKEVPVEVFDLANAAVTCKNLTKITARYGSTGGLVQNKILICGGWGYYQIPFDTIEETCLLIENNQKNASVINMTQPRLFASSVALNQNTLWIVGGENGRRDNRTYQDTTEFISIDSNIEISHKKGPRLPFGISKQCMVQYNSSAIYLIGGQKTSKEMSKEVWIIDPTKNFTFKEGPPLLNSSRFMGTCAKMKVNNTEIIVVGGGNVFSENGTVFNAFDSVELLFPKGWVEGPPMPPIPTSTPGKPRKRFHPSMFTSPDGKGVIIGGGFILDGWSKVYLTSLIELRLNGTSNEFYWTKMNQTMKIPREGPVIFTVPDDYCIRPDFLSLSEHASVTWIRLTIAGGLIIVALVSIIVYAARRHWIKIKETKCKKKKIQTIFDLADQLSHEETNPTYETIHGIEVTSLPQLFVGNIEKGEHIGSGNFSDVYAGIFKDPLMTSRKVAIKVLKDEKDYKEFFKEAFAVSDLNHENIIEFLGICIEPRNMIIFEFMEGGELLSYLRSDEQQQLTTANLMEMICDVCRGCAYMELMKFVHRDLAARNCLLTSTNPLIRKVKIGDFGLARGMHKNSYYKGGEFLPIRWMSPEALMDRKFSSKSDVWSFGVLVWEILNLGKRPYGEKSMSDIMHEVCILNQHLDVPRNCPLELSDQLSQCWSYYPQDRPSFGDLLHVIKSYLNPYESDSCSGS